MANSSDANFATKALTCVEVVISSFTGSGQKGNDEVASGLVPDGD